MKSSTQGRCSEDSGVDQQTSRHLQQCTMKSFWIVDLLFVCVCVTFTLCHHGVFRLRSLAVAHLLCAVDLAQCGGETC